MAAYPHLRNAPIREAIVDIRVSPEIEPERLEPLLELLAAESYTATQTLMKVTASVKLAAAAEPVDSVPATLRGYVLWSADKKLAIQPRVDGLAVSRLAPYERWESLRELARETWEKYRKAVGPVRASRCAVRYINQISVPVGAELKDYLRTSPDVAPDLPQRMSEMFMRLVISRPPATVIISEALQPAQSEKEDPTVIVDLDVFAPLDLAGDDPEIWKTFEALREIKNEMFFGSVTDKALEPYR